MKNDKKKSKFSNLIILLAIIHVDIFIAALFFVYYAGFTFNDVAVTCYFSFWGCEAIALAGIKMKKIRYENTYEENIDEVIEEEE